MSGGPPARPGESNSATRVTKSRQASPAQSQHGRTNEGQQQIAGMACQPYEHVMGTNQTLQTFLFREQC